MSASANVEPPSTEDFTSRRTFLNSAFSCWLARISRHCTSGRPASIIVANWRLKMTMSFVLTPLPRPGIFISESANPAFFCEMEAGIICWRLKAAVAWARLAASISPFFPSPLSVLPL